MRKRTASGGGDPVTVTATLDDPVTFQVLNEVGIIHQLAWNSATRALAPALNMSQFVVLNHFVRLGGERSPAQLATLMQVTKGAMSNTIARLHAKGLLAVQPDPDDGRGKRVSLTPAGRAARNRAVAQLGRSLAELDGRLGADEWASTLAALRKLREWFDAQR